MQTQEQAAKLWCPMSRAEPSTCIGKQCAMWRRWTTGNHESDCNAAGTPINQPTPDLGFCGLAGFPSGAP